MCRIWLRRWQENQVSQAIDKLHMLISHMHKAGFIVGSTSYAAVVEALYK